MVQTFESGFITTLSAKLNPSDTEMKVATAPTITKGRLYLKRGNTEEWVEFVGVSGTTLQNLVRGLSKTADPSTAGTGETWVAGTTVTLVAMHDQIPDKQENQTFTGDITTTGSITSTGISFTDTTTAGLTVKSLTTAERLALTPTNGDIVYDSTLGVNYQYIGGAWSTFASGSVVNASDTVAGKLEVGTTAESKAGTDTGGTGALLSVLPSDIAKNTQSDTFKFAKSTTGNDTYVISLTPNLTAYTEGMEVKMEVDTANTGACTLNIDSLGATNIKTIDGLDPIDGDIPVNTPVSLVYDGTSFILQTPTSASTDRKGIVERATDAEALAGTDTTRYITPAQVKSNYQKLYESRVVRYYSADASTSIVYTHSLGVVPKLIECEAKIEGSSGLSSSGVYDGISNKGVSSDFNSAGSLGVIGTASGPTLNSFTITAMTSTNFTVSYVKTGAPTFFYNLLFKISA